MPTETSTFVPCRDCGAQVPDLDGPVHRYLGASAGCWDLYGRLLAGEPAVAPTAASASTVDAYAAQHPGLDVPPARQSVAVHLVALHGRLARGRDPGELNTIRVAAAEWGHRNGYEWLEAPTTWPMTILDIVEGDGPTDRASQLEQYVVAVYTTWFAIHQARIEEWYRAVMG